MQVLSGTGKRAPTLKKYTAVTATSNRSDDCPEIENIVGKFRILLPKELHDAAY